MEKKKSSGLLVGLLLGLFFAVIVGVGLFLSGIISFKSIEIDDNGESKLSTGDISNTNDVVEEENNFTYDTIAGYYTAETKEGTDGLVEGDSGVTKYSLYLYENGTFSFRWSRMAPVGFIGNYIIKDKKIILNPLYDTNSGAGKNKTSYKPTTLTINQDDSLETDGDTFKKILLSKSVDDSTENWFDHYLSYEGN